MVGNGTVVVMHEHRREVQFGTTRIAYTLRRSARRGTVSIAIDPQMGVVVTAPVGEPVERIDGVVHSKARWIVEKLRRRSDLPPPLPAREFVSGESYLYLGRQYRLRVEPAGDGEVRLRAGWLVVPAPEGLDGEERASLVRRHVVQWYVAHAEERLPERARLWAERMGQAPSRVVIREPQKRWGSCDAKGTLRFNWRIMQAPMRLVDYVVAHELVHRLHADHTPEFWAALGRAMPDYEGRKDALRALGPRMVW